MITDYETGKTWKGRGMAYLQYHPKIIVEGLEKNTQKQT
jgi:hypothetical protein